ncbi:MAG: anti-sigma factor [Verrucomicrobia bacterium]|nr:MAG: anti-sigma factor [Verrucomicrobiota bacterium]
MNCEEATKLMDGYLDSELDPITSQKIEQHLRECPKCDQAYKIHGSLIRVIGNATPYYKAPAELREQIQSSLRDAVGAKDKGGIGQPGQLSVPRPQGERRPVLSHVPWNWLALAAAIMSGALITAVFLPRMRPPNADQFLATQLIASHVRSLMANHLMDVPSSDQHTVKPWLDAKLDFAAPVADLSSQGFPLIGGRLDYLNNHSVAALVYQKRKHFINLFIWPTTPEDSTAQTMVEREGYHLVHWSDGDFTYWAVSDVNPSDLQNFKQLFEQQTARH